MDFLAGLNPEQRQAVQQVFGPVLILAGAGSGKTRVITHRVCHLITAHHVHPAAILAVTFTNKAAEEMRTRVGHLLGESDRARLPRVSTFHSFCVRLLRRDGLRLAQIRPGFTPQFTLYDDDDQLSLIKGIFRSLGLDEKFMPYRAALSRISQAKNRQETPQDFYSMTGDPRMARLAVIFEQYEAALRRNNALDFDDLLLESVRLLRHDTATREAWNRHLRFLLVDEYQDTNRAQYDLMRLLSDAHQNVCVVGDEDQSIYSWRGADIRNILDFERDYPGATVIRLERNYRSTKNILDAAGAVVAHNTQRKGKKLWTDIGSGARIGLYEALDAENEALFIADTIEKILADDPGEPVAVLYRTNFQSRQIEEALRRYNQPYVVVGGFSFYQRAEIKDVLAYLKAAVSPQDSISLLRIINTPARGIGKTSVEQLERFALDHNLSVWDAIGRQLEEGALPARAAAAFESFQQIIQELADAAQTQMPDGVLKRVLERTGYQAMLEADGTPDGQQRLENINELLNAAAEAAERGESLTDFLDHAALVTEVDAWDGKATVSLLTMHNAKGLEFPYVFMAGMEEGLFPHSRAIRGESDIEEERRLCYVGMTRARKRLVLTFAKQRRRWGGGPPDPCLPSRFLAEVPPHLIDRLGRKSRRLSLDDDLFVERQEVHEKARRNLYTGQAANSVENIQQFFQARGMPHSLPAQRPMPAKPAQAARPAAKPQAAGRAQEAPRVPKPQKAPDETPATPKGLRAGSAVNHPRYGRGTVLRLEGSGDALRLTVNFPGYGLKKIIPRFAGLNFEE